jgi:hypothetical protein
MKVAPLTIMNRYLYDLGLNNILQRCSLENEHEEIINEAHAGPTGGHLKWAEAEPVENCTKETIVKFIYENIVTILSCPLTIINDQGTHFVNSTIEVLLKKLMIENRKTTAFHPQANGVVKYFNKRIHKGLRKICTVNRDDWDDKIIAILWEYRTTYKRSTGQTPFKLVYG